MKRALYAAMYLLMAAGAVYALFCVWLVWWLMNGQW